MSASELSLPDQIRLLSGGTFWSTADLPDAGVEAAILTDGPHGVRLRAGALDKMGLGQSIPATCFPTAATLANTWDPAILEEVGVALGEESAALNVGVLLGPGVNIKRHPRGGRNFEYYSEDPLLAGRLAAAWVRGVQSQGVGVSLKHFAVNNQESHRFVVDAVIDERTLREIYLAAFEEVVTTAQPWTVMSSYNRVNGIGATVNPHLIEEILRGAWGFEGLVMSDWGGTVDRVAGVRAGLDLEMPSSHGVNDAVVLAAVESGELDPSLVARSAQRVLDLVARTTGRGQLPSIDDLADAHDAVARRAAAAGTVLLRNDGILPLAAGASVALIGAFAEEPRYQGAGSSRVVPTRLTTPLDGLRAAGVNVSYAAGYDVSAALDDAGEDLIAEAVRVATGSDVAVVVVGLPDSYESEGFDRADLALPPQHDALVRAVCAANPHTVVVLQHGSAVLVPWADEPAAILTAYLGGQAGGAALADVLTGAAEPGGRLAETFPVAADDLAADAWFPGDPHQVEYREGLFVGYRDLVSAGTGARFAFGHGLGYTTFDWSGARVDRDTLAAGDDVEVTVTVRNTGERAGSDVVQVYLADRTAVVLRPALTLAGFAKVRLEPGESCDVTVRVPGRAFAFWDTRVGDWRVPSGGFELVVARSSENLVTACPVTVTGGVDSAPEAADAPAVCRRDEDFARRLGAPVPQPRPVRPFTRESTLGELAVTPVGREVQIAVRDRSLAGEGEEPDPTSVRMAEAMVSELPLRAAVLFSAGNLDWVAADAILAQANDQV